jgi:hypothetical protein
MFNNFLEKLGTTNFDIIYIFITFSILNPSEIHYKSIIL